VSVNIHSHVIKILFLILTYVSSVKLELLNNM